MTAPAGRTQGDGVLTPRWFLPVAAVLAVLLVLAGGALAVITGVGGSDTPREGSVDVGFARDMSTHHRQAVTMAGLARDNTTDVEIRTLAFDIETSQNQQVGMMQGWLQVWGRPVNGTATPMAWMGADHHMNMAMDMSSGLMPGMATEDELDQLRAASGQAQDVLFLQLMIRHHEGGVDMAQYALDNAQTDAVRNLARSMVQTQSAEIAVMTDLLTARGGQPLPFP